MLSGISKQPIRPKPQETTLEAVSAAKSTNDRAAHNLPMAPSRPHTVARNNLKPLANPLRRVKQQGRPYASAFSSRMYVGVGIYPGSRPYVASQFPDSAKRNLVKSLSKSIGLNIKPVDNAHLTLIPPSDRLSSTLTTKDLFGSLDHSTLVFKKVMVTHSGRVLLVPEYTTSRAALQKQIREAAKTYDLPEQKREFHILLGHVDIEAIRANEGENLKPYRGSNAVFEYCTELSQPTSLDLNLTSEGNLIAEQITAELAAIPASQKTSDSTVQEALSRYDERASNVEALVNRFLKQGNLTQGDYTSLSYRYAKPEIETYLNNPIHFTQEMLLKARDENIPLSYQIVSQHLVGELQKVVSQPLKITYKTIQAQNKNGELTLKKMAIIENPEVVVDAFRRDLEEVFAGFDDVVVQQVGSGVTGFSRNPDKPIKPCNVLEADVDLAIKSKQVLEALDQEAGISHMSVNRKIKLANQYTVLANSPKNDDERGFTQTTLGQKIGSLSQKWSYLLSGQSREENSKDPIVDFKLNIDPALFQSGSNLLDLRR